MAILSPSPTPQVVCTDRDQLTSEIEARPHWASDNLQRPDGSWIAWSCPKCEWHSLDPWYHFIDDSCVLDINTEISFWHSQGKNIPEREKWRLDMELIPLKAWPSRCRDCSRSKKTSDLIKTKVKKFKEVYSPRRHGMVKFLTLTLDSGPMRFTDRRQEYIDKSRQQLIKGFWEMRRTPTWKKYVDGGLWFFEWTYGDTEVISVNCHMHSIILGKYFPQDIIVELATHYGLGKIVDIRADANKTLEESCAYIGHYAKKQLHNGGRNRNAFGIMLNRKSATSPPHPQGGRGC